MPFQRIAAVGRHFKELDPLLDLTGALKKPYRRRKETLYDALDSLITRRHALIHGMEIDTTLRGKKIAALTFDVAAGAARVYRHTTERYGWFQKLNRFDGFSLRVRE